MKEKSNKNRQTEEGRKKKQRKERNPGHLREKDKETKISQIKERQKESTKHFNPAERYHLLMCSRAIPYTVIPSSPN